MLRGGQPQSGTVSHPEALHHDGPCPGQCLWAPAGGLPARAAAASPQGSTALPAQTVAAQSPPAVPVPSFPLALWTQQGGR